MARVLFARFRYGKLENTGAVYQELIC
jgi:hypothetical protein